MKKEKTLNKNEIIKEANRLSLAKYQSIDSLLQTVALLLTLVGMFFLTIFREEEGILVFLSIFMIGGFLLIHRDYYYKKQKIEDEIIERISYME